MAQQNNQSQEKGKRKFGMRMTLEEAVRDDFESGQDYVDFLNSKLQNVSIKVSRQCNLYSDCRKLFYAKVYGTQIFDFKDMTCPDS